MHHPRRPHAFLSYSGEIEPFVESLALRLRGDARLHFWFAPWHSAPGDRRQGQLEDALADAETCVAFIGPSRRLDAWQNDRTRAAVEARAEGVPAMRVIPVLLPGAPRPRRGDLPPFLRRIEPIEFRGDNDEQAYIRLAAAILNIVPFQLHAHVRASHNMERIAPPPGGAFDRGHAVVIGVASYPSLRSLPDAARNDARDLCAVLADPDRGAYPRANVAALFDEQATCSAVRAALDSLAARAGPADTALIFFSGRAADGGLLPHNCDLADLRGTGIPGGEVIDRLRAINAGRLLVIIDAAHAGAPGDPASPGIETEGGFDEAFFYSLASGPRRAVIASSRPGEASNALPGMRNSLFSHYLLEALRGQTRTLGDGYVRAFDVFRHVAERVPIRARQRPLFKAGSMDPDFAVALAPR